MYTYWYRYYRYRKYITYMYYLYIVDSSEALATHTCPLQLQLQQNWRLENRFYGLL